MIQHIVHNQANKQHPQASQPAGGWPEYTAHLRQLLFGVVYELWAADAAAAQDEKPEPADAAINKAAAALTQLKLRLQVRYFV
jgi:hypothetical protein